MDTMIAREFSPYRVFREEEWARLRADHPMTLSRAEVEKLQSLNDPVSMEQVETIYLPLSRLLSFYVEAARKLHAATNRFLSRNDAKIPFVIGLAGSVAVGKSTTARVLKALLARWPHSPKVDLVTTDGFLLPNAVLQAEGLMGRKGFPESYDISTLLSFLTDLKAGKRHLTAPVYSHTVYDVLPNEVVTVDQPDILILEGLNVLQTGRGPKDGKAVPFVSDFFDFSIYIDADEETLHRWYIERFVRLKATRFRDENSYFRRYADMSDDEALAYANDLWERINLVNLRDNILPTRARAHLILRKAANHKIESVSLRKL